MKILRHPARALILLVAGTSLAACGPQAASTAPDAGAPEATSTATPATKPPAPTTLATPGAPPRTMRPSDVPSRVVVPDLRTDLPVISGDVTLPGNPPDYPLCDVAQYLTSFPYPGRLGTTTWIYGHAREGMFLALLQASERNDGAELVGQTVDVYSTANVRYRYRISEVLRHATDRSTAVGVPTDEGRLILQTSEGPRGTVPKLQVVAELIGQQDAPASDAQPDAAPRVCANE